jgi:predicted O-methyltransferase YrrM
MFDFFRKLVPEQAKGKLDFWLRRQPRDRFGGPFNGQDGRKRLFEVLIAGVDPAVIVETGTFRGTTTEWLATKGRPVISIEADPRSYAFARLRLARLNAVSLHLGDSREILASLAEKGRLFQEGRRILAYLDAHWNADLPLSSEVDIIFTSNTRAVVVIDDFCVPGDPGYGFDDYGLGATLNVDHVSQVARKHKIAIFVPALPSDQETGFRRGCAVLAVDAEAGLLRTCDLLREVSHQH